MQNHFLLEVDWLKKKKHSFQGLKGPLGFYFNSLTIVPTDNKHIVVTRESAEM